MPPRIVSFVARAIALATLVASTDPAGAATYQIGFGANCYSPNPQDALDAAKTNPGPDNIAITRSANRTGLALVVDAHDVTISGGWRDCLLGNQDADTTLDGAGGVAAPVLAITGPATITLDRLTITGGDTAPPAVGGGIRFTGAGALTVVESRIHGNAARLGGGIAVVGLGASQSRFALGPGTRIETNTAAEDGGGIFVGSAIVHAVGERIVVAGNTAGRYGGGLALSGADTMLASGGVPGTPVVSGNTARFVGGGVYILGGRLRLYTIDPLAPTRIANNRAADNGGIYMQEGEVRAWDVVVDGNRSTAFSGEVGAALMISGDVGFYRSLASGGGAPSGAVNCASSLRCNRFTANVARSEQGQLAGPSLALLGRSPVRTHLELERVTIDRNEGGVLTGAYCSTGRGTCDMAVRVVGAEISGNTLSGAMFDAVAGVDVTLDFVTVAQNPGSYAIARAGGDIGLTRSIVQFQGPQLFDPGLPLPGSTIVASHAIVSGTLGLTPVPPSVVVADPRFVDAAQGNYRLADDSPALDFAPADAGAPRDLTFVPRGIDLPTVVDRDGPIDLGAYESRGPDPMFRDGFESP